MAQFFTFLKKHRPRGFSLLILLMLGGGLSGVLLADLQSILSYGPGLPSQTWPAGTLLAEMPQGGRVGTWHRGYMYYKSNNNSLVYDLSDPTNPQILDEDPSGGGNGHAWWKIGDMVHIEYSNPEVSGTGYRFMDFTDPMTRGPWTDESVMRADDGPPMNRYLSTFPHAYTGWDDRVRDMRDPGYETLGFYDFPASVGASGLSNRIRIGNIVLAQPDGQGLAAWDVSDPSNIRLLDHLTAPIKQYSTGKMVWRSHMVMMNGGNTNPGNVNAVGIDFSDPTDLKVSFALPVDSARGRYAAFQDQFMFCGAGNRGMKINLETLTIEQEFQRGPMHGLDDFWWVPLGHIVIASGHQANNDGKITLYAHQDTLDTKGPYVSYHNPADGATNQALTSIVGLVIDETLRGETVNGQNIEIRPLGGQPVPIDVVHTSYDVVNVVPRDSLLPNTTYEVKVIGGGIMDAAGNGIEEHIFYFSTGATISGMSQAPVIDSLAFTPTSPLSAGVPQQFSAFANSLDGSALEYRWDFGDGSAPTAWSSDSTAQHTYTQPGNYVASVQVRNASGQVVSQSRRVMVIHPMGTYRPTQSGPVYIDAGRRKVWAVNPDNGSVTAVDADDYGLLHEVPVGAKPSSIAGDSLGQIWVTCREADQLWVLDAQSGAVLHQIDLDYGAEPVSVVASPDGQTVYVATYGPGELLRFDPATHSSTGRIELGATPFALAIRADGTELLATLLISGDTEGTIRWVDLNTLTVSGSIGTPIDTGTEDSEVAGRGLPNYLFGLTIHPVTDEAWYSAQKVNILRGQHREGTDLSFEMLLRSLVSPLDLATGQEMVADRVDIDNHGQAGGISYGPFGNHLLVTMPMNNTVVVVDPFDRNSAQEAHTGLMPTGLAVDPQTLRVFVKNENDRSLTIFDGAPLFVHGTGGLDSLTTVGTVSSEQMNTQTLLGKQVFYNASDLRMGLDGYMSCGSCHLDGGTDGRTWDFTQLGEGLRNTTTLLGSASLQGRMHWSANFDEVQDFEGQIRGLFAGEGFMADADFLAGTRSQPLGDPKAGLSAELDAMAAYLNSLSQVPRSPHRQADGSLTADGQAGKALFVSLGCATCHAGPAFTDSDQGLMHDVGTLKAGSGQRLGGLLPGLDAPSLRGIWRTPPYLHDGSAADLYAVFDSQNPLGAHGQTASLTATERDQLVAYLLQLDDSEEPQGVPMELSLTAPLEGAQFAIGDPIDLRIQTNLTGVTEVVYFANGLEIARVNQPPFEGSWSPVQGGEFEMLAKVYHAGGNTASLPAPARITVKSNEALLVVGSLPLNNGDEAVRNRLLGLGLEVTPVDDDAVAVEDAGGKRLVAISSTVSSSKVNTIFTGTALPVFCWESFLFDDLGMVSGNQYGNTADATTLEIADPAHPLAAGLNGTVTVLNQAGSLSFGVPGSGAVVGAQTGTQGLSFGYETGSPMPGGSAPARRVGFFLNDNSALNLTTEGWQLFDAAIDWALNGGSSGSFPVELLDFEAQLSVRGVQLDWSTATEQNTDRFEVQRSLDGNSFQRLGYRLAAGNSQTVQRYDFLDETAPAETELFYRLKMIDLDGSFEYSPVRQITRMEAAWTFAFYPNPMQTELTIEPGTDGPTEQVACLYNAQGQVVKRQAVNPGRENRVSVEDLPAGIYFLRVGAASGLEQLPAQRVVKF